MCFAAGAEFAVSQRGKLAVHRGPRAGSQGDGICPVALAIANQIRKRLAMKLRLRQHILADAAATRDVLEHAGQGDHQFDRTHVDAVTGESGRVEDLVNLRFTGQAQAYCAGFTWLQFAISDHDPAQDLALVAE